MKTTFKSFLKEADGVSCPHCNSKAKPVPNTDDPDAAHRRVNPIKCPDCEGVGGYVDWGIDEGAGEMDDEAKGVYSGRVVGKHGVDATVEIYSMQKNVRIAPANHLNVHDEVRLKRGADGGWKLVKEAVGGTQIKHDDLDSWIADAENRGLRVRKGVSDSGQFGDYYTAKDREGNFKGEFDEEEGKGFLNEASQVKPGKWEFDDGDKVIINPDYAGREAGEVFTVSQCDPDRRKCWIGDKQGRGWMASFGQLLPAKLKNKKLKRVAGNWVEDK